MKKFYFTFYFLMLITISPAQNFTGGFTFELPRYDSTSQFFLPVFHNEPITNNNFVSTDNKGNFILNGKPIKFWSTTIGGTALGIDKEKSKAIAGRVRKMGFNMIRIQQIDHRWQNGLFYDMPSTRVINPTILDNLEYLMAQLRNENIRFQFALRSAREFMNTDGVADADSLQSYGMPVLLFDKRMIELQKEYAKQILTHVNPYTGKSLANDPALATIEITNENSLFRFWTFGWLKPYCQEGAIPTRYSKELDTLWNEFLLRKYATMDALKESWGVGSAICGPEILIDNDLESDNILTAWELYTFADGAYLSKDNSVAHSGTSSARITTTNFDGTGWHNTFRQRYLTFEKDSVYILEFWAKADIEGTFDLSISDGSTWNKTHTFKIHPFWEKYRYFLKAPGSAIGQGMVQFNPLNNGILWFDSFTLKQTGSIGVETGENFADYTIMRNEWEYRNTLSDNRLFDLSEFYTKIQLDYYTEMVNYLRNELNVRIPLCGSNWLVGPEDLPVQSTLDFIDNHAYWDHPIWSSGYMTATNPNWKITNRSMINEVGDNTVNYLFSGFQIKGKPFTISEYNHPFPNRYLTEFVPIITAYSAFQGADEITLNAYNGETDWESNALDLFDLHKSNGIMVMSPVFGYAFRNNLIKEATSAIEVNYSLKDIYLLSQKIDNPFGQRSDYIFSQNLCLVNKFVTSSVVENQTTPIESLPDEPVSPFITSTGEVVWDTTGIFTIETDKLINFTGFLDKFSE